MNKEMGDHMNDLNFLNESRLPKDPNKDPEFGIPQEEKYPLFEEKSLFSTYFAETGIARICMLIVNSYVSIYISIFFTYALVK